MPRGGVIADAVAAWYVADILRGAPPPENAPPGRIAFKTGTSYGFRDAWAVGFDRRLTIGVWVGRPDGSSVPGLVGRVGCGADPVRRLCAARRDAGAGRAAALRHQRDDGDVAAAPRHLRQDAPKTVASTTKAPLRIAYPYDGSRIELGLRRAQDIDTALAMKATGGALPLTWLANGAPVEVATLRREASWRPDGAGFVRLSVIDSEGATDSVLIRID